MDVLDTLARAGDRSPKKERDEKKQKTEEASKDKARETKSQEAKPAESKSTVVKEQDDLEEQMRLRREKVARWRAEKEVRVVMHQNISLLPA